MNAIAKTTSAVPVLQPQSFDQLVRFAEMAAASALMPRDYQGKPANIMIAVQMGSELGLAPMQAIQNIAVVNGRPSVFGDALIGLVRASSVCDDVIEVLEGEGDRMTAICTAKRKGKAPVEVRFSVEDAKKANLWGKQGPWQQYPKRMLQMRARGFALRDAFPDVLKGLITAEEAADTPVDNYRANVTATTIEHTPAPEQPRRTERPTDYVRLIGAKAERCTTEVHIGGLRRQWIEAITKASDAGRPIAEDVQEKVFQTIQDREAEIANEIEQERAQQAAVDVEEIPA